MAWVATSAQAVREVEDPRLLARVVPLVLDLEQAVARAAIETSVRLFPRVRPGDVAEIDAGARRSLWRADRDDGAWLRLRVIELDRVLVGQQAPAILAVLSMHTSGHVREAAVERLSEMSDGVELPFLLVRANDWVPQVRRAAEAALRVRVRPERASHWIRALPALRNLRRATRSDHAALGEAVAALLHSSESAAAIREGVRSSEPFVRATCFTIALAWNDLELLDAASRDSDWTIRLRAARALVGVDAHASASIFERLAHDRAMPIRREVFRVAHDRAIDFEGAVRRALFDLHPALRRMARAHTSAFGIDPLSAYREEARGGVPRATALLALGETGDSADLSLVEPFLRASSPALRKAALRAFVRLAGDASAPHSLEAIRDPCVGVSRVAALALVHRLHLLPPNALPALVEHPSFHVRRHAIRLMRFLGRWPRLLALLRATTHADRPTAALAVEEVWRWYSHYNRGFSAPSPAEIAQVETELASAQLKLPGNLHFELESIVASWRR